LTRQPWGEDLEHRFSTNSCINRLLQVLTLPAFPTSVMGTVVNKRANYNYLRLVQDSEQLTYR
jgi:hypothetical protein